MRRLARSNFPFVLLALTNCHKEAPTTAPVDEKCFGARCVEQAEAAMYYKDYEHAREPLTLVCEKKDGFQCFRLAELYQLGRGGPVDLEKAAYYYEQSCSYEYGEACERRCDLARDGNGGPSVELDYAIKGCQNQRPVACARAAEQLRDGRGVERDPAKAIEFFEQGCGLGETVACTAAGDLLMATGKPDGKNKALSAYIRACTGHHPEGCLKVGIAFHEGIGTRPDIDKALQHFTKACEWGHQDGCHVAEQIKAAEGKPVELELTTSAAEIASGGLQARELSCRMSEHGQPALDEVMANIARHKDKLDKCNKGGAAVGITWEFEDGKVREVKPDRFAKKSGGFCVAAALKKVRMPATGTCTGVLLVGDPSGAAQAVSVRAEKVAKAKERNTIHVGDEDEE